MIVFPPVPHANPKRMIPPFQALLESARTKVAIGVSVVLFVLLALGAVALAIYLTLEMPTATYLYTTPKNYDAQYFDPTDPQADNMKMEFEVAVEVENKNWFGFQAESLNLEVYYPSPSSSDPSGYFVGTVKHQPDTLKFDPNSRTVITLDGVMDPTLSASMDMAAEWLNAAKEQYPIHLKFNGHVVVYSFEAPVAFESDFMLPKIDERVLKTLAPEGIPIPSEQLY